MKYDMLGLIFAENPEAKLGELTSVRALAAVPAGGRYRIIDFMLSNMVNSAVTNVGLTTPYNYQSLTDHLGTGKDWDLDRKEDGLFILPPKETGESSAEMLGGVDVINGVMHYLTKSKMEYAVVVDCNTICNIKFNDAYKFHMEQGADITLIYTKSPKLDSKEVKRNIFLDIDEESKVITDLHVYPTKQKTDNVYMHMFIIRKELLMDLVEDAVAHGKHQISKDIFLPAMQNFKLCGYEFSGYKKKIDNIQSYFDFNMDLLQKDVRDELFGITSNNPIYTKIKDTVPAKYGKNAEVSGSFVADGCIIEGTVRNSILFRGVHVGKGAVVENCILMQNAEVLDNCLTENVIFDKEVVLRSGKKLVGQATYPMVIGKGTVI